MITTLKSHLLSLGPHRPPGYVAAVLAAASEVHADRLLLTPDAFRDLRARFPSLPAPREYGDAEAAADALLWPATPAAPAPAEIVPLRVPQRRRHASVPAEWGPGKWAKLHTWARSGAPGGGAWLNTYAATLPGGCPCQSHWRAVLAACPFDPGDPFRWSWRIHNEVNADLGKPPFPYEAALAMYPT